MLFRSLIKIKKLFQNKIFLNIGGYTLAFAIGLFLASYVAEKQKNTIHSQQSQTEQQEVGKNRPDKDATFKIEKLGIIKSDATQKRAKRDPRNGTPKSDTVKARLKKVEKIARR